MTDATETTTLSTSKSSGTIRILAIIVIVAGVVLAGAGVVTYFTVRAALTDENITVSDDAGRFAGQQVQGPFTAYEEANVIQKHALEATGGKTYAELDREDPVRQTAMTASFLRASLFTSVVAFGVAAMAIGLGIVIVLVGVALLLAAKGLEVEVPRPAEAA